MDRMICIAGPTASGKTALSVALAKALGGEIVSCDSMQVYRGMDIGTAKPTLEERQGIAHHLLDVADPGEPFSVGKYVELADAAVQDILRRGRLAIVVGGTGLYMDSLILGRRFAVPSTGQRAKLERLADERGIDEILSMLQKADPETAARLHPSDRKRIIRAMEVFLETGTPISRHDALSREQPPRYEPLWLGIRFASRAELYARIERRVDEMLRQGLLGEVEALLARGLDPNATALQAIGYKELVPVVRGETDLDTAVALLKQSSRRYAKRQLTWFGKNERIRWLRAEEEILPQALSIVHASTDFDK